MGVAIIVCLFIYLFTYSGGGGGHRCVVIMKQRGHCPPPLSQNSYLNLYIHLHACVHVWNMTASVVESEVPVRVAMQSEFMGRSRGGGGGGHFRHMPPSPFWARCGRVPIGKK